MHKIMRQATNPDPLDIKSLSFSEYFLNFFLTTIPDIFLVILGQYSISMDNSK